MKAVARSLVVVLVALISVPALVVTTAITSAVQLLATTALIMGGTQHPLSTPPDSVAFVNNYFGQAVGNYITPGTGETNPDTYAVIYPAEFFPVFGTTTFDDSVQAGRENLNTCLGRGGPGDACNYNQSDGVNSPDTAPPAPGPDVHFVVFGYSQSAVVASLVKNDLINDPNADPYLNGTEFVLASNPMRPNGGILGRGFEGMTIPFFGITFYGPTENSCGGPTCAPGDPTVYPTVDVAQQYDFLGGDAPARPLNLLAMANSLAAYAQLHGDVPSHSITEPGIIDQGTYGDTHYYMIPADRLPILMPLQTLGVPSAALALPDAILRVWIEDAYARDKSPGEHVQFAIIPIGNPVSLIGNTLGAVPVGIDDTVQQATGTDSRPLGTADVYRPFGVGGPVYDKTTGVKTTDNVGIPTGSGGYGPTSVQPQPQPQPVQTPVAAKTAEAEENQAADTGSGTTPKVTKPDQPLIRNPFKFDPPKPPSATQPRSGGPLKRIFNGLTGQRPQTDTKTGSGSDTGDAAA
ncbi:hypothetical protein A5662_26005 [Mycobacteriaceae bacterium 1482268.1]|nr:hypothetical protein A5662_26005 [Mycobacteriaceae bacterium 1482268.1]